MLTSVLRWRFRKKAIGGLHLIFPNELLIAYSIVQWLQKVRKNRKWYIISSIY